MNAEIKLKINRSVFDRENWKEALNGMTEFCDSFHTHIVIIDKKAQLVDAFVSTLSKHQNPETDGGIQEYLKFKDHDIRLKPALSTMKVGDALNHQDLFEGEELEKSIFYKEYLSQHRAENQALAKIYGPNDNYVLMAVIRDGGRGRYSPQEINKIKLLSPLIQNTLHSQFQLERNELYCQTITTVLEQNKIGVIYLDEQFQIMETSPLAQRMLNEKDGLIDSYKMLKAVGKKDSDRLQKFLATDCTKPHYNSIFINRSRGAVPYKLTVSPIMERHTEFSFKQPKIMLLVSEPNGPSEFPSQLFREQYGLNNSEMLLAEAIYKGQSLSDYSESRGIKVTTTRWTLANIFSKTDTHSQKELKSLALVFS